MSAQRMRVFVQDRRFRQDHKVIVGTARGQPQNEFWPWEVLAAQDTAQNANAFASQHRPQKLGRKPGDEEIAAASP